MSKYDLTFASPILNAAGSLGFCPERRGPVDLERLGAFITNPISRRARRPAQSRRCLAYPGGFLLHSGFPNPGITQAIRRNRENWSRSSLPVIAHLLAEDAAGLAQMVGRLEGVEGITGIEVGLPLELGATAAAELLQAALGELPVVARLPFERAYDLARALAGLPLAAFSLGPPRGVLPGLAAGSLRGRLYGPAIFPQALAIVAGLAGGGIPVIGAGGVYGPEQVQAMLAAGAAAVQVDAALWSGDWLVKRD